MPEVGGDDSSSDSGARKGSGESIAPEHVGKIFQPFFTIKPYREGTGLGLCIVDRVVTQADGSIRVENSQGEGVAFCVTLPVRRPHGSISILSAAVAQDT